ncbi:TetR/AcrR family transcriptional regulator [Catenulispora acidiphila]|uniref:TetR/AcrR family transcriptional regulator n=1 Tax=Catenulispora acidiphila TaxID=304895 RepID=UPI0005A11388|nr:TetR/AcrR family transcriptional regulator [Catenulispora acidiphila]
MSPRPAQPDIRRALIEAAATILAESGPDGLSTRQLAREVGVSTTAVYTYFGGMDDLVRAMVHEGFARLNRALTATGDSQDPVADVVRLGRVYRENALRHRHLYAVMFGGSALAGFSLTDEDRAHGLYTLDLLVAAIERCVVAGRFRSGDATLVAHELWMSIHGIVTLEIGGYLFEPYDADACFDAQVCTLLVGSGDGLERARQSIAMSGAEAAAKEPAA